MKRWTHPGWLLVGILAAVVAACSITKGGGPTTGGPDPIVTTTIAPTTVPIDPVPIAAPVAPITIQGPDGCVPYDQFGSLLVQIAKAPAAVHLVVAGFVGSHPTCEPTNEHVASVYSDGKLDYAPGESGQLRVTWSLACRGRLQLDIRGGDTVIRDVILTRETDGPGCAPPPPPPPPPTCATDPKLCPPPPPPPPHCDEQHPHLCPPPPTCAQLHPPAFNAAWTHTSVQQDIAASAEVKNTGDWILTLYAGAKPGKADYTKRVVEKVLQCGGAATLTVSYPWEHHPSKYWWFTLARDGGVVFTGTTLSK